MSDIKNVNVCACGSAIKYISSSWATNYLHFHIFPHQRGFPRIKWQGAGINCFWQTLRCDIFWHLTWKNIWRPWTSLI